MGHVVRTDAGTYRANWRDPAGRQRAKTFPTKRAAREYLAKTTSEMVGGAYIDPHAGRRVLLRDYAEQWSAGRTVEATTDDRTRSIIRTHLVPRWGDWPLTRIDHMSVQQWVRELAGTRAPATVKKALNVLSLIMASAVRSRLLAVNPCGGVTVPSNRRTRDQMTTLTREEFAGRLLPSVPAEHRALLCVAAGCGLRWGECAGL
ncbi:MAG: site-specific integrase, partial [Pseudonocardia sp.]|nr:site-specific integrase [Pseudonocardia sp.]